MQSRAVVKKIARQMAKDYLVFPALSRTRWRRTMGANVAANVARNLWAYLVIFCGHFPDGAEKFTAAAVEEESKSDWYLRQMLGTANFNAAHCWRSRAETCAIRSSTICSPTCPVTTTLRSPPGCGHCAGSSI